MATEAGSGAVNDDLILEMRSDWRLNRDQPELIGSRYNVDGELFIVLDVWRRFDTGPILPGERIKLKLGRIARPPPTAEILANRQAAEERRQRRLRELEDLGFSLGDAVTQYADERRRRWRRAHEAGASVAELARHEGVHKSAVTAAMAKHRRDVLSRFVSIPPTMTASMEVAKVSRASLAFSLHLADWMRGLIF